MSLLFSPLRLRDTVVRNRLWVTPMGINSAPDGVPGDWHHVHLNQFVSGGAGLILTEATAVTAAGRITPRDTGLWNDVQTQAWRGIIDSVHQRGGAIGVQLAHAGRKGSIWWPGAGRTDGSVPIEEGGWPTLAPSAVAYQGYALPSAMTVADIDNLVDAFTAAARRAVDAGFDVIEIHAAHGYVIHQFLSPLSNRRTDEYGGSLDNRARLLLRVVAAVRSVVGEMPIFVRFSGVDWAPGGWGIDDTITTTRWAAQIGADLFDISSGGLVAHQSIPVARGYQVNLAAAVRRATGELVAAVGLITDGQQAEEVLSEGAADAVFAGREWLRHPHFALRAAGELGDEGSGLWPVQYASARLRPVVT